MSLIKTTISTLSVVLLIVTFSSSCSKNGDSNQPTPTPTTAGYTRKVLADQTAINNAMAITGDQVSKQTPGSLAATRVAPNITPTVLDAGKGPITKEIYYAMDSLAFIDAALLKNDPSISPTKLSYIAQKDGLGVAGGLLQAKIPLNSSGDYVYYEIYPDKAGKFFSISIYYIEQKPNATGALVPVRRNGPLVRFASAG